MATVKRFEDLEAFQMARELTKQLYRVTGTGRFARDYGLRESQFRGSKFKAPDS
jgi:hypothetical protein